jgi:hypothetical protein
LLSLSIFLLCLDPIVPLAVQVRVFSHPHPELYQAIGVPGNRFDFFAGMVDFFLKAFHSTIPIEKHFPWHVPNCPPQEHIWHPGKRQH